MRSGPSVRSADRARGWYRAVMWVGIAAGLAGTIGGAVTLVTEGSQAALVGPVGSVVLLVVCARLDHLRVEVTPDAVIRELLLDRSSAAGPGCSS